MSFLKNQTAKLNPVNLFKKKAKKKETFRKKLGQRFLLGVSFGLGQALGLTLIFTLILSYLLRILNTLGGVPFLGNFIADIIDATQKALERGNR